MPTVNALRVIAINLAVLAGGLLGLNVLCGIYLDARMITRGERNGAKDPRVMLPAFKDKHHARQVFRDFYKLRPMYVPYEAFRFAPFTSSTANVDKDGLRITPGSVAGGKPAVHFFGGSTMWGTGVDDGHTIPALAMPRLGASRVVNYGQSAFVSRQSLAALESLGGRLGKGDIVIFYDGVNDVFHYCQNRNSIGGHGFEYFLKEAVETYRRQEAGGGSALWRVMLGNIWDVVKLATYKKVRSATDIDEVRASRCDASPETIGKIAETLWRNWLTAKLVAERDGAKFLAVLQPVSGVGKAATGYLPQHADWDAWYRKVYALLQARMAAERADWVIDLTQAFDDLGPVYFDWCHVSAEGNARIADLIAQDLKRRMWVK